jgi:hypothetical protein
VLGYHPIDHRVRDEIRQPIGAEDVDVSGAAGHRLDVWLDVILQAHRPQDDVALTKAGDLFRRADLPVVHLVVEQAVVPCDLDEPFSLIPSIHAAVSHVGDDEMVGPGEDRDHRGSHALELRVFHTRHVDTIIGVLNGVGQERLVGAGRVRHRVWEHVGRSVLGLGDERHHLISCDLTGHVARSVTAHAVTDHVETQRVGHPKRILVVVTPATDIRQSYSYDLTHASSSPRNPAVPNRPRLQAGPATYTTSWAHPSLPPS